jgi:hypothetical protein
LLVRPLVLERLVGFAWNIAVEIYVMGLEKLFLGCGHRAINMFGILIHP